MGGARGNGGQALNTASNTVILKHIPTNITVRCCATRYLEVNKKKAHSILFDKVEHFLNPETSKLTRKVNRQKRRNAKSRSRAKKKYGTKQEEVEEEKEGNVVEEVEEQKEGNVVNSKD